MDVRLYIVGGFAILVVSLVVYLVFSLAGYVRAVRRSRAAHLLAEVEPTGAYVGESVELDEVFGAAGTADRGEVRTGDWMPRGGEPPPPPPPPPEAAAPEPAPAPAPPPEAESVAPKSTVPRATVSPEALSRIVVSEAAVRSAEPGSPPLPEPISEPALASSRPSPQGLTAAPDDPPESERDHPQHYTMVSSVELHFSSADGPVGVRPGTATHEAFHKLAASLLASVRETSRD